MSDPSLAELFPDVAFTPIEESLLSYLMGTRHRYAPKPELLREVWGYSPNTRTRTVETTVQRVRAKIEPDPTTPSVLLNVRGQGYRLHPPGRDVSEELQALQRRLAELMGQGRRVVAVLTADERGASVPRERDRWIGRPSLLTEAESLLADHRLVTLHGGPGLGKTRLATRIARRWVDEGRGEAWFCALAEARTGHDVWSLLARVLGIVAVGDTPVDQLVARALDHAGTGLLVLDNAEHLVDDVARVVAELLDATRGVSVLCTSRERLRVAGEQLLAVDAMDPDEALALFEDRVRAVQLGSGEVDRAAARRIVARLEGIPLALELAAARARFTPLATLADRVESGVEALSSDQRGVDQRRASLRGAIAWSWDLLSDAEQRALGELSVFRGGASLEAMRAVLSAGDDLEEVVSGLLDKAMVRGTPDASGLRVSCFESVREFAAERVGSAVVDAASARHAAWFTLRAEQSAGAFDSDPRAARFLLDELPNLLAALDWLVDLALPQAASLISHLWRIGLTHGQPVDYLDRVEQVVTMPGLAGLDRIRVLLRKADALIASGRLSAAEAVLREVPDVPAGSLLELDLAEATASVRLRRGAMAEALARSREAAELSRRSRWPVRHAKLLIALGAALQHHGRVAEAVDVYSEAEALADRLGVGRVRAVALANLASASIQGPYRETAAGVTDEAAIAAAFAQAEALAEEFDDRSVLHSILGIRATRLLAEDRLEEADALYRQLLEEADRFGGRVITGVHRVNAGFLSLRLGRWEDGVARLRTALERLGERGEGPIWALGTAYLGVAERYAIGPDQAAATFAELDGVEGLGAQVDLAIRLCRAHLPDAEGVDELIASASDDPALVGLVEILTAARGG